MAERIRNETCPGRYDKRKWPIRIEIESIAYGRRITNDVVPVTEM